MIGVHWERVSVPACRTDAVCGRYVSVASRSDLQTLFGVTSPSDVELPASWNVAPTQPIYAAITRPNKESGGPERRLEAMRWGLVPSWSKSVSRGAPLINARVESLAAGKPAFRAAYVKRRAAIPAAGYYEWMPATNRAGKTYKQPYYIHPQTEQPLIFAGLYELWRDPARDDDDPDRWLVSTTIITTDARGTVAGEVHDRTPVILPAERVDAWLDPATTDQERIGRILSGIKVPALEIRAVSTEVNRVTSNGPQLLDPVDEAGDRPLQLALAS
jgi:putative SOS response-associated peptidase YedK